MSDTAPVPIVKVEGIPDYQQVIISPPNYPHDKSVYHKRALTLQAMGFDVVIATRPQAGNWR